ncbi:CheR family methyltransferase [Gluconacetobacter takamatsuzukensis]|uniref:Chemotaxis protein methyltransferase n=1 Tax=Gluconacetobacter takamatsuzukensis TaxID=1286190 RepID=A0A7W4PR82_9PROT|nr:protein-glutamate O-methyltransferase CheR [Gluconacetobacter takamatsuzukensis]MBB2203606.1 protein-glutamate O-methyltransferase CheR [Gluconacetobacter takamatsuzukensis]
MNDLMPVGEADYTDADFQRVQQIAREQAGIHLPITKKALVYSRVSRRLRELNHASFHAYLDFVTTPAGQSEMQKLICALTTNVTSFFREKNHFEHLETVVMPQLAAKVRTGKRGRLWSAACSTGQEPWSIAMSVMTAFPDATSHDLRILATDINTDVVAQAAEGVYSAEETEGIPSGKKSQFMEPSGDGDYRFNGPIRRLPAFRALNLNASWPIRGSFTAIFCRNVVIYFDDDTRERLWQRLAEKLEPDGFLYVGHSERVSCANQCGLIQVAPTIYRKGL